MLRQLLIVGILLMGADAALACDCGAGGLCGCTSGCSCGTAPSHSSDLMTTPNNQVVALDAGRPSTTHIGVTNFSFSDNAVINVGDTIQWDWLSGVHTVTSVSQSAEQFDSGVQTAGSFSHTFTEAGTFWYYCQIHGFDAGDGTAGGMAAKVTVVAAPEPATAGILLLGGSTLLMRRKRRRAC
jgi:plastocyanin